MPLIDTGYTLKEARELISQKLPAEDSSANLIEVLHAGEAKAEMTCDTTGNTYRLPSEVWKSTDGRFDFDIESSQGSIQEKLVRRPTPSYTAQPRGHFDRDGHFRPNYVTGEVRIERTSFDALLDKVGGDALLKSRRRGRRARSLEAAKRALDTLYSGGVPNKPWKTITAEVNIWLVKNGDSSVSDDTVRRAATGK